MGLHFDVVDVFTDRAVRRQPARRRAPGADDLTARQMQAIAAEFGLSETAFTAAADHARGATTGCGSSPRRRELPFAGTPERRGGLGAGARPA